MLAPEGAAVVGGVVELSGGAVVVVRGAVVVVVGAVVVVVGAVVVVVDEGFVAVRVVCGVVVATLADEPQAASRSAKGSARVAATSFGPGRFVISVVIRAENEGLRVGRARARAPLR